MKETFITKVSNIVADTSSGLSSSKLSSFFIGYADRFKRTLKYADVRSSDKLVSKRDFFKENLQCFSDSEKFFIINDLCNDLHFLHNSKAKELRIQLIKDYSEFDNEVVDEEKLDYEIVEKTKHWLEAYPKVLNVYNDALKKYKLQSFERNVLDDMRLCLELLLKELLNNNKPLEKQLPDIGTYIKHSGGSKEFSNMLSKLVDYYSLYQNAYAKHDDKVNRNEFESIIELSSLFMRQLIRAQK